MAASVAQLTLGAREWGLIVVLSLLWGASFLYVELALADLPPFSIVFGRVFLAAAALHLVLLATGQRMPGGWRTWGAFFVLGTINNVIPFSLIVWGQTQITSGLASILNATAPLFAALLAHLLTRDERLTIGRTIGVLLGFGGVIVMIGPALLVSLDGHVLGQLAVLGAACAYALAGIFARRLGHVQPLALATGQLTAASVLMLPLALVVDRPWLLPTPGMMAIAAVIALALIATALAYVIYFRVLATAGATNLLLVTFLIPASALVLGALFLDESVEVGQIAGLVLIIAGLVTIDGRALAVLRRA